MDIFEHTVLCNKCNSKTKKNNALLEGFQVRTLECNKCSEVIYHPGDLKEFENFKSLKSRDFDVKLRMVGNSFCISIPKELIDFHKQGEKEFNNIMKLNLESPGKIIIYLYREGRKSL
ncbi:MAG: hypothetical protein AABW52_05590 [Nanoarchaeota archaeon]